MMFRGKSQSLRCQSSLAVLAAGERRALDPTDPENEDDCFMLDQTRTSSTDGQHLLPLRHSRIHTSVLPPQQFCVITDAAAPFFCRAYVVAREEV